MVIHLDDVRWARMSGYSMKAVWLALIDVHMGLGNFPDALAYNLLITGEA